MELLLSGVADLGERFDLRELSGNGLLLLLDLALLLAQVEVDLGFGVLLLGEPLFEFLVLESLFVESCLQSCAFLYKSFFIVGGVYV